jgi:hypothetical protein
LREFIGREKQLPFDQHALKALCAPRALLTTEALEDRWANPQGTYQTYLAAKEVYRFLGVPDKIGIHFRRGKHELSAVDFSAMIDFADQVFFGRKSDRDFNHDPFHQKKIFSWTAPAAGGTPP